MELSSPDQSISPYKHIRNPKRNHRSLVSPPNSGGGILSAPPLLPLPIPNSDNNSRKIHNRTRDQSRTPKKSKPSVISPKTGDFKSKSVTVASVGDYSVLEKFSGPVVFTLSPPPSSLPLPTFSLRPKLASCHPEAAGIDAGATDNLRRLLRLQ